MSHIGWVLIAADGARTFLYDDLRRPVARNADTFAYNRRGEVASATVAGRSAVYDYDFIGNFTSVAEGDAVTAYSANALNHFTGGRPRIARATWRGVSDLAPKLIGDPSRTVGVLADGSVIVATRHSRLCDNTNKAIH